MASRFDEVPKIPTAENNFVAPESVRGEPSLTAAAVRSGGAVGEHRLAVQGSTAAADRPSQLAHLLLGSHGFALDFLRTLFEHLGLDGCSSLASAAKVPYLFMKLVVLPSWRHITCSGSFGGPGSGMGQFQSPIGICRLPDGTLCIAESRANRLQVVDQTGRGVRVIPMSARRLSHLHGPVDVDASTDCVSGHGDVLFVADCDNHRILATPSIVRGRPRWRSAGGEPGSALDQLTYPRGVAVSPNGKMLFVADSGNHRVVAYDPLSLTPIMAFGGVRSAESGALGALGVHLQLIGGDAVAVGAEGEPELLMCDATLAAFAPMGNLHSPISTVSAPHLGETLTPFSLALCGDDIFVCCYDSHVIMVFRLGGQRWRDANGDDADATAEQPTDSGGAASSGLSACDRHSDGARAEGAGPGSSGLTATAVRIIGRPGHGAGEFHHPRGVATIPTLGLLVVTEARRVQVLTTDGSPRQMLHMEHAGCLRRICIEGLKVFITDGFVDASRDTDGRAVRAPCTPAHPPERPPPIFTPLPCALRSLTSARPFCVPHRIACTSSAYVRLPTLPKRPSTPTRLTGR